RAGRDGALIDLLLYELEAAPALPLFIPLPHNTLLSKQCAEFMEHPNIHSSPKDWAHDHNKSERTFHRWFKSETGLSFQAWRNRVCIIYALNA
ncbi:AraC family transcriptional regulator, partial [Klebsiella pneumoniae]|nr:AraC family transcriptional regulator [Klebsiella pneumoniae]